MLGRVLLSIPQGLLQGASYGAIALGLSVIFGVSRVTNFSHGALLMVSAYLYYELFTRFGLDPYLSIVVVAPVMFAVGYAIQKALITPILQREKGTTQDPTSLLLITLGLGYAIQNLFTMMYGSNYKTLNSRASESYFTVGDGLFVTQWSKVIACIVSFLLAGALWYIINRTELGKKIRAVSQNRDAAALCGINVYHVYGIAFGLGVAAVSVAGASLAQYYFIQPEIGTVFATKSFMIVVLGGLGSIPGALISGIIFGLIEVVGAQFVTSSSAQMFSFLLFIIVLFIRPAGLFGRKK